MWIYQPGIASSFLGPYRTGLATSERFTTLPGGTVTPASGVCAGNGCRIEISLAAR